MAGSKDRMSGSWEKAARFARDLRERRVPYTAASLLKLGRLVDELKAASSYGGGGVRRAAAGSGLSRVVFYRAAKAWKIWGECPPWTGTGFEPTIEQVYALVRMPESGERERVLARLIGGETLSGRALQRMAAHAHREQDSQEAEATGLLISGPGQARGELRRAARAAEELGEAWVRIRDAAALLRRLRAKRTAANAEEDAHLTAEARSALARLRPLLDVLLASLQEEQDGK